MISISIPIYCSLEVSKQSIPSVLKYSPEDCEIIFINNHPPYEDVLPYFMDICQRDKRARLVDAGKNIGCNKAMDLGFSLAKGKYLVKLDDDTELTEKCLFLMEKCLDECAYLPYVTACGFTVDESRYHIVSHEGYTALEIWPQDSVVLNFPCGMFRKSFYDSTPKFPSDRLYGGEEVWYRNQARTLGYKIARVKEAVVIHRGKFYAFGSGEGDIYGKWKYEYGFKHSTDKDFPEWLKEQVVKN